MTASCAVCQSRDVSSEEIHKFGQTDYLCDECEEALVYS
jgi:predicted SprT family Zn-dependent metalloprotease